VQAQALLWAADGIANEEIARRSSVDADTVRRWRTRFADTGVAGVGKIAAGRGRKSWLPAGTVERVLEVTAHERPPGGATHWSTRTLAARLGIGKDAVARIWASHGLKPWRVDTFKISNDPEFEAKLVDRTQPSLPMKRGRAGTMTHDYKRHGTVDLFAALDIGTGQVLTHLRKGHPGTDVLADFDLVFERA
jgi:transposase